jgi:alkanesulfonate monooxygenase SsuD/methylene tetrahydromethanopterin reductase-like flavin-dependent oxidoreductase (luciferase family)
MLFSLRFDFRNPDFAGTTMAERYAAALDMAEWADALGCVSITVCEHHGSPDGYIPSPLTILAAMAARTKNVRLMLAALLAPFWDPLRLAEDLCVVDHISNGRLDLIVGAGYAREEFAMFDVPMKERPARVTEVVNTLRGAFSGKPFAYRGRTVHITPPPCQAGGPKIIIGGSSEPAARRAARIGDAFVPTMPEIWDFYRDEMRKLGKPDPGPFLGTKTTTVALATDADKGWEQLAPYFLHDTNAYGMWQAQDNVATPYRKASDANALRASGSYRVVTPEEMVIELKASPFPFVILHPLCGGIPPDLGWESLELFEHEVLPAFPAVGRGSLESDITA